MYVYDYAAAADGAAILCVCRLQDVYKVNWHVFVCVLCVVVGVVG
jgi:hypothetical protein